MTAAQPSSGGKVRVLVVVGTLMQGGAETYVANVARAIRKYGVGIEICALDRTGPLLDPLLAEGVHVYETPYPSTAYRSNTRRLLATIDTIRRIVKAGRYDIVHTYLYWSDVLGVAGARLAGCRRIIISRQAMHGWIHPPGARFHNLEQTANLFANELIACSETALKDAVEKERILPAIRTVIYNGVDVNEYQAAQQQPADGALRLVTVGALAHRKGQEYAIDALAQATRSGVRATLELVGQGPDEPMLRHKVAEAGLENSVIFAGQQVDPRPYLAHADVFLLPSRQEGFSVALLEAMASSLPAIATDAGGNAEALVDGMGGRVVPPEDPAAMASAIAEMARDRGRLPEMGRFNRERVKKLFSVEASAGKLADWYISGPR